MGTRRSALRFSLRELLLLLGIVGLALSSYLNYSPLRYTGNPLDLAIDGQGFFCLTDERTAQCVYTRRGTFTVDDSGRLVLRCGDSLWPVQPSICIPADPTAIAISPSGLVLAREGNTARANAMGQLQLASFARPSDLREIAPGIFSDTAASGPALLKNPANEGTGLIRQGARRRADR